MHPRVIKVRAKSPWIVGVCTVRFDVDVGQQVDVIIPDDELSDEEKTAVAFHSFPVSLPVASILAFTKPMQLQLLHIHRI